MLSWGVLQNAYLEAGNHKYQSDLIIRIELLATISDMPFCGQAPQSKVELK